MVYVYVIAASCISLLIKLCKNVVDFRLFFLFLRFFNYDFIVCTVSRIKA